MGSNYYIVLASASLALFFILCFYYYSTLGLFAAVHLVFYTAMSRLIPSNSIFYYIVLCVSLIISINLVVYYLISHNLFSISQVEELFYMSIMCYCASYFLCVFTILKFYKIRMYISLNGFNVISGRALRIGIGILLFIINSSYIVIVFYLSGDTYALVYLRHFFVSIGIPADYIPMVLSFMCYQYLFTLFIYFRNLYFIFMIDNSEFSLCRIIDWYGSILLSLFLGYGYELRLMQKIYNFSPALLSCLAFFFLRYILFECVLGKSPPYIILSIVIVVILLDKLMAYNYLLVLYYLLPTVSMLVFGMVLSIYFSTESDIQLCALGTLVGMQRLKHIIGLFRGVELPMYLEENRMELERGCTLYNDIYDSHREYYSSLCFGLSRILMFLNVKYRGNLPKHIITMLDNVLDMSINNRDILDLYSLEYTLINSLKVSYGNYMRLMTQKRLEYGSNFFGISTKYIDTTHDILAREGYIMTRKEWAFMDIIIPSFIYTHPGYVINSTGLKFNVEINDILAYITHTFVHDVYKSMIGGYENAKLSNISVMHAASVGICTRYSSISKGTNIIFPLPIANFFGDNEVLNYSDSRYFSIVDYLSYIEVTFLNINSNELTSQLKLFNDLCLDHYTKGSNGKVKADHHIYNLICKYFTSHFNLHFGDIDILRELVFMYVVYLSNNSCDHSNTPNSILLASSDVLEYFLTFVSLNLLQSEANTFKM